MFRWILFIRLSFSLAGILLGVKVCSGQLDSVHVEVYYVDDGTVPGYPCGYTTFRMYAVPSDTTYRIQSVTVQGSESPWVVDCGPQGIWNTSWGGLLGQDLNETWWGIQPAALYDSFITISKTSESSAGPVSLLNANSDELLHLNDVFDIGTDPEFDDSGTYIHMGDPLVLDASAAVSDPGSVGVPSSSDGPTLIMQVTTNQTFHWEVNVVVVGPNLDATTHTYLHADLTDEDETFGEAFNLVGSIEPVGTCLPPCGLIWDFDFNGIVDIPDVLSLLGELGCSEDCSTDVTGDGGVTTADLLDVLGKLWVVCIE